MSDLYIALYLEIFRLLPFVPEAVCAAGFPGTLCFGAAKFFSKAFFHCSTHCARFSSDVTLGRCACSPPLCCCCSCWCWLTSLRERAGRALSRCILAVCDNTTRTMSRESSTSFTVRSRTAWPPSWWEGVGARNYSLILVRFATCTVVTI